MEITIWLLVNCDLWVCALYPLVPHSTCNSSFSEDKQPIGEEAVLAKII